MKKILFVLAVVLCCGIFTSCNNKSETTKEKTLLELSVNGDSLFHKGLYVGGNPTDFMNGMNLQFEHNDYNDWGTYESGNFSIDGKYTCSYEIWYENDTINELMIYYDNIENKDLYDSLYRVIIKELTYIFGEYGEFEHYNIRSSKLKYYCAAIEDDNKNHDSILVSIRKFN